MSYKVLHIAIVVISLPNVQFVLNTVVCAHCTVSCWLTVMSVQTLCECNKEFQFLYFAMLRHLLKIIKTVSVTFCKFTKSIHHF